MRPQPRSQDGSDSVLDGPYSSLYRETLETIHRDNPESMAALGRSLNIHRNAACARCEKLESEGLIELRTDILGPLTSLQPVVVQPGVIE